MTHNGSESNKMSGHGYRGASEQERREQILKVASEQIRHYGYQKTTVADIAKSIHLSTAYLYNFFESKRAIGEAVCAQVLTEMASEIAIRTGPGVSPSGAITLIFNDLSSLSMRMFSEERRLHDLLAIAFRERWRPPILYKEELLQIIRAVVVRGRELGEFERKTSLEETCEAIRYTIEPFFHPILLEQESRRLSEESRAVGDLVLRSLQS